MQCKPATLVVLEEEAEGRAARLQLTIAEGKYHQIKRMVAQVGKSVVDLHRSAIGPLKLDPNLPEGGVREVTEAELRLLASLCTTKRVMAWADVDPTNHDPLTVQRKGKRRRKKEKNADPLDPLEAEDGSSKRTRPSDGDS
jgi:hypothetical protein